MLPHASRTAGAVTIAPMAHYGTDEPCSGWTKSSHSFALQNCVEVASLPGDEVGVRDSKDPGGPPLAFPGVAWAAFVAGVRNQEF